MTQCELREDEQVNETVEEAPREVELLLISNDTPSLLDPNYCDVFIIISAILASIFCYVSPINFLSQPVLMPFFVLETVFFVFCKRPMPDTFLIKLLVMSSIPRNRVKLIAKTVNTMEFLFKDLCLYFFMFLLCHSFTSVFF